MPDKLKADYWREKLKPKKSAADRTAAYDAAREMLREFWAGRGPRHTLEKSDLEALGIRKLDAEKLLEDFVPPKGGTGTTGKRVDHCHAVLSDFIGTT